MDNSQRYDQFYTEASQQVKKHFERPLINIASPALDRSGEAGKESQVNVTVLLHEKKECKLSAAQVRVLGNILKQTAANYALTVHFENVSGSIFEL